MKRMRTLSAILLALLLLLSFASAEETAADTKVMDGFTVSVQYDGCIIEDVDESAIADGILLIPREIDGTAVFGFRPAVIKDGVRLVIRPMSADMICDEDNAPEKTLRYYTLVYGGFRDLSADMLDRLPDMTKEEYALIDYYQTAVSRNGSVSYNVDDSTFLMPEDIPESLFGKKAYNMIDSSRLANTDGDWTYTLEGDYAVLRGYAGTADRQFIIPEKVGGVYVQSYKLSVIPKEAEYVYCPTDCWPYTAEEEDNGKQYIRIEYCSYEKASRNNTWMLEDTPAFTEDVMAVSNISEIRIIDQNINDNSYNGLLSAEALVSEINGKPLILDRVSWCVLYADGDWDYCLEGSGNREAVIVNYRGTVEDSFVFPEALNGFRVRRINIFAVPTAAKYIYVPNDVYFTTDKRYGEDNTDRNFTEIQYASYENAKENNTWLLDSNTSFTEGTYTISNIYTYKFTAATKDHNSLSDDTFIPADEILPEINGLPLTTGKVSEKLSITSGEYTYSFQSDGDLTFISGPASEDGTQLMIPETIDGKEVRNYYMNQIPETVTEVFVPNRCGCWSSSKLTHEVRQYSYRSYDMIHSEDNVSDSEMAVEPGEYMLTSARVYTGTSSETLVQDYYLYPTSFNGQRVHMFAWGSNYIKTYTSGQFTYFRLTENEACISAYSDNEARKVEVPATLDGLTVVGIDSLGGGRVFNTSNATEFILPDTIRIIGDSAIYVSNKACKQIKLPAGLKVLGRNAISNWYMQTIELPDGLESIGTQAIYAYKLTKLVVPDSVKRIDSAAFRYLYRLQNLTLPAGLTEIPSFMCSECDRLGAIVIPEKVTVIRESAFNACSRLSKVTLNAGLKKIEQSAFVDCKALKKIDLPEGLEEIGYQAFYGCKALSQITIPASVTRIDKVAFGACTGLAKVNFTDSVLEIAEDAFKDCSKKLTFFAPEGSYAYDYAVKHGINVKVPKK